MDTRYDQISPVPPLTPVVRGLVIACVVLFFADFLLANLGIVDLREYLGIVIPRIKNDYWLWQFVSYIFMHGQPLHLLLNMLILWYFGSEIEMRIGAKGFLTYFFLCGIGGGIFNFAVNVAFRDPAAAGGPIIGSSGAIYGILAAYGIFFGSRYFLVFFLFPMKAKYFVLIVAALELFMGVQVNPNDNIAHFAHLGGMGVGAFYLWARYFRNSGGGGGSKRDAERERLKRQFTLIVNQDGKEKENKGPFWN